VKPVSQPKEEEKMTAKKRSRFREAKNVPGARKNLSKTRLFDCGPRLTAENPSSR
jgi:hypothetical protein